MPKKRQALIEFNEITSAITCVNDAIRSGIMIAGQSAYMNYSNTQKIARIGYGKIELLYFKFEIILFNLILF